MKSNLSGELGSFIRNAVDNGAVLIAETEPMKCSDCGQVDELRPCGKNGAWVCFPCGMKDEKNAKVQFAKQFNQPRLKSGSA